MYALPLTILTITGFWQPAKWNSSWPKYLYNCYTVFAWLLIITSTLSMLLDLVLNVRNVDEFIENCFILLTWINSSCKMTYLFFHRNKILNLLEILGDDLCSPRDHYEQEINANFYETSRFVTTNYGLLVQTSVVIMAFKLFINALHGMLPFRTWQPYSIASPVLYWLTYLHQASSHFECAAIHIGTDTLIANLMLQVCAQLEILKYRLANLTLSEDKQDHEGILKDGTKKSESRSSNLIIQCVYHHRRIIQFTRIINDVFDTIMFVQFSVITLLICSIVYLLSKLTLMSVQFIMLTFYASCMLSQIFIYCWCGNEVILKSSDIGNAIYRMDWVSLCPWQRKHLLMVMLHAKKPIKFTSSFLITVSLDSYKNIIKMSYSIFNLLQKASV